MPFVLEFAAYLMKSVYETLCSYKKKKKCESEEKKQSVRCGLWAANCWLKNKQERNKEFNHFPIKTLPKVFCVHVCVTVLQIPFN